MLAHAESHGRADPEVQAAQGLESVDQRLGGEVAARAPQSLDEQGGGEISLERNEVRLLAERVLGQEILVAHHGRRLAVRQRDHLRDDDAFGDLPAVRHQLVRQRLAADERDVAEDDVRPLRLHLVDELRRRPVRRDHHHRPHGAAALEQRVHRLGDVGRVPLVADAQRVLRVAVVLAHHLRHAVEPRVPVAVLLSEDRDLVRRNPPDVHQVPDRRRRLLRVAGAVVEDVAIGRIAPQQARAGEGTEEEHLLLQRVRHGHFRGGRPDVPDESEHVARLRQLLHHRAGTVGLVAVVESDEAQLAPVHAARLVRRGESEIDAGLHPAAQLLGGSRERRGHAEDDLRVGDARNARPRLGFPVDHRRRLLARGQRCRFLLRAPPERTADDGDGHRGRRDHDQQHGGARRRRGMRLRNHDFLRSRGGLAGVFFRAVRLVVGHHLLDEELVAGFPDRALLGGDVEIDVELALAQAHGAADGVEAGHLAEAGVDDLALLHEHDHVVLRTRG